MRPVAEAPGLWERPGWRSGQAGTFALIIGVSAYPYLAGGASPVLQTYGLPQLAVSALTAYRFFAWLRDRYAYAGSPLARCWLLLSPTQAELEAEPAMAEHRATPTMDACRNAISDWVAAMRALHPDQAARSRSFFFFSGHGLELSLEQQILLPSDYLRPKSFVNEAISTANLWRGMASLRVPHQFFFIDACRNDHRQLYGEDVLEGQRLLDERRSAHANPVRVAPLLFASASGTQSWQPHAPDQGLTLYGQALLEGLQGEGAPRSDCGAEPCAVKLFPLQRYVAARVAALLAARQADIAQIVRLGGVSDDVVVTQLPAGQAPPETLAPLSSESVAPPRQGQALRSAGGAAGPALRSPLAEPGPTPQPAYTQPPLSMELASDLAEVLRRCGELRSDHALRAVFVIDELKMYQNELPEARSVAERVDLLIGYLRDERSAAGEPALATFVRALAARQSPRKGVHQELLGLLARLRS